MAIPFNRFIIYRKSAVNVSNLLNATFINFGKLGSITAFRIFNNENYDVIADFTSFDEDTGDVIASRVQLLGVVGVYMKVYQSNAIYSVKARVWLDRLGEWKGKIEYNRQTSLFSIFLENTGYELHTAEVWGRIANGADINEINKQEEAARKPKKRGRKYYWSKTEQAIYDAAFKDDKQE
jgi:hypothetical protein